MKISFVLNGEPLQMDVQGDRRLIDLLRDDLRLTGTKEGCGEGACGACTVLLDNVAVHACLTLAGQIDGCQVLTVEGFERNGQLDLLQECFIRHQAIQCGYCMPGMLMAAKGLLLNNASPTEADIRNAISGNVCRCGGYEQIIDAIAAAAAETAKSDVCQ